MSFSLNGKEPREVLLVGAELDGDFLDDLAEEFIDLPGAYYYEQNPEYYDQLAGEHLNHHRFQVKPRIKFTEEET